MKTRNDMSSSNSPAGNLTIKGRRQTCPAKSPGRPNPVYVSRSRCPAVGLYAPHGRRRTLNVNPEAAETNNSVARYNLGRPSPAEDHAVTRTLSRKQSVILGALVLLAIGLGAVALFALHERYGLGRDAVRVTAAFADVGGVEIGTRVRIQGIDAGDVEDILPPAAPGAPVR